MTNNFYQNMYYMEEAQKFHEWMLMIKSIHLADNKRMSEAYARIIENSNNLKNK